MITDIFRKLYRQNISVVLVAISVLTMTIAMVTIGGLSIADAQQQNMTKTGTFNYTQTDALGNPDWINTGNWSLTGIDSPSPTFEAVIDMVKPNGSAAHEHEVSDLVVSGQPSSSSSGGGQNNSTTVIEGTTTITMREGPVTDEPTTITLSGKEISVYFDPAKIDDHFGNQSITGSVTE